MNLQITAVIDPADRRQRMKIRRGSGRAQFVSFNFTNYPIWAIESRVLDGRKLRSAQTHSPEVATGSSERSMLRQGRTGNHPYRGNVRDCARASSLDGPTPARLDVSVLPF
jgi:hypothetical protein